MKKLKVYKDEGLKQVQVKLDSRNLIAVDSQGGHVAYLYKFYSMIAIPDAEKKLRECGYDTSFAEWDDEGRMAKLLVDFE